MKNGEPDPRQHLGATQRAARHLWKKYHGGNECPSDKFPNPDDSDLIAWLSSPECSETAREEADRRLNKVMDWHQRQAGHDETRQVSHDDYYWAADTNPPRLYATSNGVKIAHEEVDDLWSEIPEEERPSYPLNPLIKEWQARPRSTEPDRQDVVVSPETMRSAHFPENSSASELFQLPPGGTVGHETQIELPGFACPPSTIVPTLPLFADKGVRGHRSSMSQVIWFGAILAYPRARRPDKDADTLTGTIRVETTLRDIKNWLYPGRWERKKSLPRIYEAMKALDGEQFLVVWERRLWRFVSPLSFPTADTKLDDPLYFYVWLPPGSTGGPLINQEVLWKLRVVSMPAWRAWIRLAYVWDKAKARNGGHRIFATRPKVSRNENGYLLDAKGDVIRGPDPNLPFHKRKQISPDKPVSDWSDSRAIILDKERNPRADHVPVLSNRELIRLCYDERTPNKKWSRQECRKALFHMEEAGYIVIEQDAYNQKTRFRGWRILEPRTKQESS